MILTRNIIWHEATLTNQSVGSLAFSTYYIYHCHLLCYEMKNIFKDTCYLVAVFSSYDETDEDCLSPNLDDITSTEVVEDSSMEESTLSESVSSVISARLREPGVSASVSRVHPITTSAPGYVNLSSIYSIGSPERWANQPQAACVKNGYPEKKIPSEKPVPPEKPVSLMMVNGKMDNRYAGFGGNNSFLYSQLLASGGARAKDPPSYSVATSGALFDKNGEKVTSPSKTVQSPVTSPVNGVNKISDNYERAVAERLSPQREISRLNRSSLFSKVNTGMVSSKVKKKSNRSQDEEDDDYARDSDECSI